MAHPVIDTDECIACGVCVDACPADVLELNDVATVAEEDSCVACGACQDACPAGAITEIAEDQSLAHPNMDPMGTGSDPTRGRTRFSRIYRCYRPGAHALASTRYVSICTCPQLRLGEHAVDY